MASAARRRAAAGVDPAAPIGLIAGVGRFPFAVARAVRARGQRLVAVAFRELTQPEIEAEVDALHWLELGQLGGLIDTLRAEGVCDAVMAGGVPKTYVYQNLARLRIDDTARRILARLADHRDDSLLGAFAAALEDAGFRLRGQAELAPELLAGEGPLGALQPNEAQRLDIAFGWPVAKAIAGLDIGQSVVVKERAVIAVEAIEGTDAAIRRGGELGGEGVCVVKVAKPSQDLRFDVPVIGTDTVETLASARASVMAIEASATVVLERALVAERADACGISIVGVPAGGPLAGPAEDA